MICRSFEPVFSPEARVMIVGSMPGVKSIADKEYYAHPRNSFWPILFDVFGEEPTADYEAKKELVRRNGLALWDVAGICEREGSLDSSMKDVQFNDFAFLYEACPNIHTVLCNGAAAHNLFMKSGFAGGRRIIRLPSTSPAYTMPYEKKRLVWRAAIEQALKES